MGYAHGRLGATGNTRDKQRSKRNKRKSKQKKENTMTIIQTSGGIRTWKGDPTNQAAIAAWKSSYQTGYKSQIISPRDSSGNYTSDPIKTVTHTIISKEQQANEIVTSLKSETAVPASIIQSLGKTLGIAINKVTHRDAPTGITDTKRITGDNTVGGYGLTVKNLPFIVIAIAVIIIGSIIIKKM
jgi:hypothetical protein